MSIFSHPPPQFTLDEASSIALNHFGCKVKASVLMSERDQNFYLQNISGAEYVLKISNPAEDCGVLVMQNKALKYIQGKDPELKVPLVLKSRKGEEIISVEKGDVTYNIRLVKYLNGQFLKDTRQSESMLLELGAFLGRLDNAFSGFDNPAAHRDFPWDARYLEFIKSHKQHLATVDAALVGHFLEQYEAQGLPIDSKLRKAVIHNDGHDHNVLVNENGQPTGIIDFGDLVYSYIVCEPAVCMAYVALEKDDPFPAVAGVLKGFHKTFPLLKEELRAAVYLACIRSCITLTMAAYRKKLFPDNVYILITEKGAKAFLKKMKNENLCDWSERLTIYAQS